jgi:3-oxoacyl-[acyl-carrier-protein] synthase II
VAKLIPQELGAGFTMAIAYRNDRLEVHGGPGDLENGIELTFPLNLNIFDVILLRELYLAAVFGDRTDDISISATKSLTGHLMGAAGAVESIFTVLAVHNQTVPGVPTYRDADPEIVLNIPRQTVRREIRYAISDNVGLGGHNGAVVYKRYEG